MYGYEWTDKNEIFKLSVSTKIEKEIRPVFSDELNYFGANEKWSYPNCDAPLLWAEGIRNYIVHTEKVAEAIGGNFYSKPSLKFYKDHLQLEPIDISQLWETNKVLMTGLEQKAIKTIRDQFDIFSEQGYTFAVAFSGGKDSLTLLDLVSKALSPDEFYVVFSDTGMELQCTYDAIEKAKAHWNSLRFYEAKSHLDPNDSWEQFGPPGRRMRWCCSVHKSVPTILKLREITGNYNIKAVVFDGVRAEESFRRSSYEEVSIGAKNINQINCSPILNWNAAEIYLYLLHNNLLFNSAYRAGLIRVGCKVCPMSSFWWDGIANDLYKSEMSGLLSKVEDYAANTKAPNEQKKFISSGGWKARMGGRGLENGGNRVTELIQDDSITFSFSKRKMDWKRVAVIAGPFVENGQNNGIQKIGQKEFSFEIIDDEIYQVKYSPFSQMDRFILSHLRGIANKIAYCIGCKACSVQCPTNAFTITEDGKIFIREKNCIHCYNCISFSSKGCLVAKSLSVTMGGNSMNMKGMNRYQHFGLRQDWLEHFFTDQENCFTMGILGNRQYDALKVWLKESNLFSPTDGKTTDLFRKLENIGPYNPFTWAIIWANLAYSSIIVKWYMLFVETGETYEKSDLVNFIGDDYTLSTRDNAVTALCETLRHSPIGSVLKQGVPIPVTSNSYKYRKIGWETPDPLVILYALYLYAEKTGRYDFTLRQLAESRNNAEAAGVDPVAIYGLDPDSFKEILSNIAIAYPEQIRVSFQRDLDNVRLFREIQSLDIIDLAAASAH